MSLHALHREPYMVKCKRFSEIDYKLQNILQSNCFCANSLFQYSPHKHVITGDLSIIKWDKLRFLFSKGANYHSPENIDWDKIFQDLCSAIDLYIEKLMKCHKINNPGVFNAYHNQAFAVISSNNGSMAQFQNKFCCMWN